MTLQAETGGLEASVAVGRVALPTAGRSSKCRTCYRGRKQQLPQWWTRYGTNGHIEPSRSHGYLITLSQKSDGPGSRMGTNGVLPLLPTVLVCEWARDGLRQATYDTYGLKNIYHQTGNLSGPEVRLWGGSSMLRTAQFRRVAERVSAPCMA